MAQAPPGGRQSAHDRMRNECPAFGKIKLRRDVGYERAGEPGSLVGI
jgi:hypothetical protein